MMERSAAEVAAQIETKRRERDSIISRQSFYCTRRKRFMTPALCHDCFAALPYLERLTRWNENRMRCVKAHRASHLQKEKGERDVSSPLMGEDKGGGEKPFPPVLESYSIDEYMSRGLLEFLLDLDVLAQRFETWWMNLADPARQRIHQSAEAQEMILWLAERLQGFQRTVLLMGRRPEEQSKDQKKEEQCGVKN
jgi:Zn ribbon nucleic-acid-binding protein